MTEAPSTEAPWTDAPWTDAPLTDAPLAGEAPARLLDRVRKLLAKAEDESVTPPEAQALTAKAADLTGRPAGCWTSTTPGPG